MAADTVTVKFKILEDGTLAQIGADAEKTAKSTDKATKSSTKYNKQQKGVAGLTSNTTKGFSKMTTGITGGLVPAYATLAANVFAVSAAFNFFKRAADVRILQEGQKAYAANTGLALQSITASLREASAGMLGFREAAEAAAIGVAKGFSPKQLEDLAVGARKASAALGRGFEDSFDRLIRGASKAEPELLDELGITLRLVTATEKYGRSIGKSADELTAFERSQAVLIETQRQLNAMFGSMEGTANPFVELSKTFEDIIRAITDFLMPIFATLAKVLTGSAIAAIAVFGALGLSILKSMIPMDEIKEKFKDFEMGSQASVDSAKQGMEEYRLKIKETALALKEANAKSVQGSAKALGPRKSKLITSAQEGTLTDPKQIGMLKAHLKKAEQQHRTFGEVRKGIFAKASKAELQNLRSSLTQMGQSRKSHFKRAGLAVKQFGMTAKLQFKKVQLAGTKAFSAIGRAAGRMSSAMNKAMKMAGFIGMFIMIMEIGEQIMQAPYTILMSILKGVDFIIKAVLKGIGMFIDTVGNMYAGIINTLVGSLNWALDFVGLSIPFDNLSTSSTTATDAMEKLGDKVAVTAELVAGTEWGKSVKSFQDARVAAAELEEAYDDLKQSITDTGTELDTIVKGIASNEKRGIKALNDDLASGAITAKEFTAGIKALNASLEKQRATALASLGASRLLEKALNIGDSVKDADKRAHALEQIKLKLKEIGALSPAALAAIEAGDVGALIKIEDAALRATGNLATLEDGLSNIGGVLTGGDLGAAESALRALSKTLGATGDAFTELFGGDSVAAAEALRKFEELFKNVEGGATAYLASLVSLRQEQNALTVSTAAANLVQGEAGDIMRLNNSAASAALILAAERNKLLITKKDDPIAYEKQETAITTAEIGVATADSAVISKTQGSGMGAAHMAGELARLQEGGAAITDQQIMSPMLAELTKLGPEGELITSVVNGAFAISDAFGAAFAEIGDGGLTMETGLAAAAAGVQAIGAMMAASSKNKIANIDNEIKAEQKRDGKSAASVAKIKALEKKKEAAKKKAFEVDKKVKMASTIIATAEAVMNQKGNLPMMIAMGVMGAAQLAIIAGTSYQGGSSGGGEVSAPSAVNMGERSNTVDLGKGNNAGGELAYMRGESGIGTGATNFKPTSAFSGYKNRSAGGYIVGEQGPEIFMPETPGEIIPAGRSMGGAPANVNFNISAVDATGVEDVLIRQKGHIIRMIREAANEHGDTFLESVRDEAY